MNRPMTRREYMRRQRQLQMRRRRRIFYLCSFVLLMIFVILFYILIRRLSSSEASADPGTSPISTYGGDSLESSAASSLDTTSTLDGYELRQMSEEDIHKGTLILVNKNYAYTFPEDLELISMYDIMNESYDVSGTDVRMDQVAAQPLCDMLTDFYQHTGLDTINILCGYRTKEESQALFDASVEENGLDHAQRFVMLPGYSEHHSALSTDLGLIVDGYSEDYTGDGEYAWINQNCQTYGFIVRYPDAKKEITQIDYEPWHFRYLGVPNATAVVNEGLCLEEYIEFIKGYTADGPHYQVTTADGAYEIYYAAGTEVYVPIDREYEISGNNIDGFIITVKM